MLLALAAPAGADLRVVFPRVGTVAEVAAVSPNWTGWPVIVTDGLTHEDCATGGGSFVHWCAWSGSAWVSTTAFDDLYVSDATANADVFIELENDAQKWQWMTRGSSGDNLVVHDETNDKYPVEIEPNAFTDSIFVSYYTSGASLGAQVVFGSAAAYIDGLCTPNCGPGLFVVDADEDVELSLEPGSGPRWEINAGTDSDFTIRPVPGNFKPTLTMADGSADAYFSGNPAVQFGVNTTNPEVDGLTVKGYTLLNQDGAETWFPYTDGWNYISGQTVVRDGPSGWAEWVRFQGGNVGIGETSIQSSLHITHATDPDLIFEDTDGAADEKIVEFDFSGASEFALVGLTDAYGAGETAYTFNLGTGSMEIELRSGVKQSVALGAAATTFAITSDFVEVTGDAGANTIATITGGEAGVRLTLLFVDALVTITDDNTHASNSVDLSASFTSADDTVLDLLYDGTSWYERSRSVN